MSLTQVDPGLLGANAQYTGFKNRIINGAMVIDQRNAGASFTPTTSNTYTLDRWTSYIGAASKFSIQQNAGSVTPPTGFTKYLGITSLAATSLAAGDYYAQIQPIEGFNIADLGWGTAGAATVTVSFRVYSSLTGTFGGSLRNGAGDRSYPFTYSIPTANTWTTISITIAGETTGTWATNNTSGALLCFGLGVGSTYSGTAGVWGTSNYLSATGATSVVGTNGATFYITGVQLEKGSTATSFDYRPYGAELSLCQRYYQRLYVSARGYSMGATYAVTCSASWAPMRAIPTWSRVSGPSAQANVYSPNPYGQLIADSVNSGYYNLSAASSGDTYAVSVLFESTGTEL